jgi:hypothetical protein
LTPEFYAQIPESRVRERIAADLRGRIEWPNPWSAFDWAHVVRRELTLTPHATLSHLTVHTPFLDRDGVDFMSGLPIEMMFGGGLHADESDGRIHVVPTFPFARDVKHSHAHDVRHRLARLPRRAAIHVRAHSVGPSSRFLRRRGRSCVNPN